jgi:hypothetical protein
MNKIAYTLDILIVCADCLLSSSFGMEKVHLAAHIMPESPTRRQTSPVARFWGAGQQTTYPTVKSP